MRNLVLLTCCRHRPMDARKHKHRCRILLAASEPVAYRLVCLLVRERSALSDPYCQSTWNSVGLCVRSFVCVCPQL